MNCRKPSAALARAELASTTPRARPRPRRRRYVANANPQLTGARAGDGSSDTVPADTEVVLTATWDVGAAETYLYYEAASQTLVDRRRDRRRRHRRRRNRRRDDDVGRRALAHARRRRPGVAVVRAAR
jgi:hypothetical protein